MGNYLDICPCAKKEDADLKEEYKKSNTPFHIKSQVDSISGYDANFALTSNMDTVIPGSGLDKSHTNSRLPTNVIDFKIKTKNFIVKRTDSPQDHYDIDQELGCGSFGTVYKVSHKVSRIVRAMKIISKDVIAQGVNSEEIINEINILRQLDHPNIMKIFEFYEDKDNFYIVSDFLDQGDLCDKLKKIGTMSEFLVKFFMNQIFSAIAYLHSKQIVHGDVKMENILLYSTTSEEKYKRNFSTLGFESKNTALQTELNDIKKVMSQKTKNFMKDLTNFEVKLIDFGCSKMFNRKKLSGIIGTSVYCSPEVIDNNYREECDEWACGILMYVLLAGEPPFYGEDDDETFALIKKGKYTFDRPEFKKVSPSCKDIIQKLLHPNPHQRLTAAAALKHPFFTNVDNINVNTLLTDETDMSLLNELQNTKTGESKFHDAVIAYIALNFVDKDEEKKIRNIFRVMNKDQSSYTITKTEFARHLKQANTGIADERIEEIFNAIDSDLSGSIEYQELIRALSDKKNLLQEKNLKSAFDFLDTDGSGSITWEEINNAIFPGEKVENNLMTEFLAQINKSQNDLITFEEFCAIMRQ